MRALTVDNLFTFCSLPWGYIKPIRLHERHATLTDHRDKITMSRASDSYKRKIMPQIDLQFKVKTRVFGRRIDKPNKSNQSKILVPLCINRR